MDERNGRAAAELVLDLDRRFTEVLGLLDGPTATQRIIEDVPEAAGVDAAWVGWPSDNDHVVLRHGVRMATDAVNGLVVARGIGLGGQVLALKRPMWVRNYITAPNITHDFATQADTEGVLAMVAVPIQRVRRRAGRRVPVQAATAARRQPVAVAKAAGLAAVRVVVAAQPARTRRVQVTRSSEAGRA